MDSDPTSIEEAVDRMWDAHILACLAIINAQETEE